jgi:hypothetical protein
MNMKSPAHPVLWVQAGNTVFSAPLHRGAIFVLLSWGLALNAAVIWHESFEGGTPGWSIEGTENVWEIGIPTSGPNAAFSGERVAATRLDGNYPSSDARLVSPEFIVPAAADHPRLRYWHWYDISFDFHYGQLQIQVDGGEWEDLPERVRGRSGGGAWVQHIADLRPYAGETVRIGFHFVGAPAGLQPGWYIDEVSVETGPMVLNSPENFEEGLGDWSVENGLWQWGIPAAENGPESSYSGTRCVGTILAGNYPARSEARLISPEFLVPPAVERPRLRYFHWYDTASQSDYGQLQIRASGGEWQDLAERPRGRSGGGEWIQRLVDLRPYGGQSVQIAFLFVSGLGTSEAGWFIDQVSIETGPMRFDSPENFEEGFGDWSVESGVWQWGVPMAENGPDNAHSGTRCFGTVLRADYPPHAQARLVSPEFVVPQADENPRFRYYHWHNTGSWTHYGQLQIKTGQGEWEDVQDEQFHSAGGRWIQRILDLRPYAGEEAQVGFLFVNPSVGSGGAGWFVDSVSLETGPMALPNPDGFENGFGDWSSEGGMWQVGTPADENGPEPYSGGAVAGTILDGSYSHLSEGRLVSPEFIVPALAANPRLSFYHWHDTAFTSHNGRVQIKTSEDGWTDISPVFSRDGREWQHQEIDLGPFAGQVARIAFRFVSNTGAGGPGWFIDDFAILSDTLDPIEDQTLPELEAWNLPLEFTGNNLRFEAGNAPEGMEIDPVNGVLEWVPSELQGPGIYEDITIRVTQPGNWLSPIQERRFTATVQEINHPPVLILPSTQTIPELSAFQTMVSAIDADIPENSLTFELVSGPQGLVFDPESGAISWTPTEEQGPGEYDVTLRVTDLNPDAVNQQQLSDQRSFTIVVQEVNHPPVLAVPPDQTVNELSLLTVSASATDPDIPPNPLTFSLVNPPLGMAIHPETGSISWTPSEEQGPAEYVITVRVTDQSPRAVNEMQLSDTGTFTVTVLEVNHPPVFEPASDLSQHHSLPVSIHARATDPDIPENRLLFSLLQAPPGMSIDSETGWISWSPAESDIGEHSVTVQVTDDGAPPLSDSVTFLVTITDEDARLEIIQLPGGLIQIDITGAAGFYELLVSGNLVLWELLEEIEVTGSPHPFVVSDADLDVQRFYILRSAQD